MRHIEDYPKPPRGTGEDVLYLDFDGVLHHEKVYQHPKFGPYINDGSGRGQTKYSLFEHCDLLIELLDPYPEVRIVLSTSWAVGYGFTKAAKKLPPALRDRCIGGTFHREMDKFLFQQSPRGMQVWSDVTRREPANWLALDDDYVQWPEWCLDNYVQTDPVLGIRAPAVRDEIERKLALMHQKNSFKNQRFDEKA